VRAAALLALGLFVGGCVQAAAEDGEDTGSDSQTETSESETGSEPSTWQTVYQANDSIGALMSVWGPTSEEVFVVGGQPDRGQVLRGRDTNWVTEFLPNGTPMLNWVYGVGDDTWAVGIGGAIVRREPGEWVAETSPTDRTLWGVWGASADELWAVGGDGVSDDPVLLRRDGATDEWALVELPPLGNSHALFKIWGTGANDVWSVGDAGAIVHWDGQSWTSHSDPDGIDLISVWGWPDGAIAVGGRANGRMLRLVDGEWSGETLDIPGLNGVWVDPFGRATVVGAQGTIYRVLLGGFELEEEESGTVMVLHSVFGFDGGPRFAVGGSLLMPPPYVGVILQID
jgi:hypothetical protein